MILLQGLLYGVFCEHSYLIISLIYLQVYGWSWVAFAMSIVLFKVGLFHQHASFSNKP